MLQCDTGLVPGLSLSLSLSLSLFCVKEEAATVLV